MTAFDHDLLAHSTAASLERLVVKFPKSQFSWDKIVEWAQNEQAELLSMSVSHQTETHTELTLYLVASNINALLQCLRRHGGQILSQHDQDYAHEDLESHAAYLTKYLEL